MKYITVVNSDKFFDKDFLFNRVNEDDLLFPFYKLKQALREIDVFIHTSDILQKKEADFIIYNELPKKTFLKKRELPRSNEISKSFLMLLECAVIRPDNYELDHHEFFNKILTWDDNLIKLNSSKYIKSNFTQHLTLDATKSFAERSNFCVCISGNKKVSLPNELYSERKKVVEWFENNQPASFNLYGRGWGHFKVSSSSSYNFLNRLFSYLPSMPWLRPSWHGAIDDKLKILSDCKYNLCFENAQGYDGYITEKIFDTFKAGAVPIYWGASNIQDHIPDNCYIDFRQFEDINDCYSYLQSLSAFEYSQYQKSIKEFINSEASKQFKVESFINNIKSIIK